MDRAEKVLRFLETLCIPEGMDAGKRLVLRPFQEEIILSVYGDLDSDGLRRTRKAIFSVGKKNGKTPLVAGLALTHLIGPEAKTNEQIYSAAYERDQAAITFRYMRQMIEMDEQLDTLLNIRHSVKEIECGTNGSIFKALSSACAAEGLCESAILWFFGHQEASVSGPCQRTDREAQPPAG